MSEETQVIEVVIQSETKRFYSPESNFGIFNVVNVQDTDTSHLIEVADGVYNNAFTIKGSMPYLENGKTYKAKVVPKVDKKWGLGYEVVSIYEDRPTTREEQETFLRALLTEKQVDEIFKIYPDNDVLTMIAEEKFDFEKVKGIGEVTFQKIKDKVLENIAYREAIIQLSDGFGLSHNTIKKMSDAYGSPTLLVQKINEDPYILSYDVDGIGFKKADDIALAMGVGKDSPKRIGACILYILEKAGDEGHSWISKTRLIGKVAQDIKVRAVTITDFFDNIESNTKINSRLYIEGDIVALERNRVAEEKVAYHLQRLLSVEGNYKIEGNLDVIIDLVEKNQGFEFTHEQRDAIKLAVEKNVIIINGKAGTGKTSVLKGVVNVLKVIEGLEYATCALSGKASQRIQESTGLSSSTMHRLLGYNPQQGFTANEHSPLDQDIVVLDEASMVNSYLMSKLVCAVKVGGKLIILGDTAQLEPIGVGNVLVDLISSGEIPRVELTIVHRQAQKSGILSVANKVREGKQFAKKGDYKNKRLGELKDLYFMPYDNGEEVYDSVLSLAERFNGKGNIMDFQVIVPMKERGNLSTRQLNSDLQNIFNPDEIGKGKIVKGKVEYREGDKVIQNGNNYDLEVFNGTLGIIKHVDNAKKVAVIEFEGAGLVEYEGDALNQIDLAYALTVHRTQGSQFKHVVFAFDYASYVLLSRQIVYTALTRAVQTCFMPCELKALLHAVRTDKSSKRNTFLERYTKETLYVA